MLWGLRVTIPPKFRKRLLEELHEEHLGMCRMKAYARGYMWWPKLDGDIEKKVKACEACLAVRNKPPTALLHPWRWAARPWQRSNSHSKWIKVIPMTTTMSTRTIEELRTLFASHGLSKEVVSDNGH